VHIVIMGCGRVGSTLAHILEDRGESIAVIDRDPEAFRRLGSSFKGDKITGIGFDRAVLTQAGTEHADAFAAVSSGDNSNILSARVAREVFERLGIPTVATVRWTADQMLRKLLPEGGESLWRDPTGKIVLAEVAFSPHWIGEQVKSIEVNTLTRIVFVDRLGQAFVPDGGTVLQEGDVIHVVAREDDMDRIAAAFAARGGGH